MNTSLPSSIHTILACFAPCFTAPGFGKFTALIAGLILCQGRHTITKVIQAAGDLTGGRHHSAFYRFLGEGSWDPDQLSRVLFGLLLPLVDSEVLVAVDDTLCRRGGAHLWGAGMHHDAGRSTYGWLSVAGRQIRLSFGHNWVVAAVWVRLPWNPDRGVAVPVAFRLYRSRKKCPERQYRKRTEIAADLLELLSSWLPEDRTLHVVADSEYANSTVIRRLPQGTHMTGAMPMNAALYALPPNNRKGRPRVKGKRIPSPAGLAKSKAKRRSWTRVRLSLYGKTVDLLVKIRVCVWYSVARGRWVKVVVTRDPRGIRQDRAYFTTDLSLTEEEILLRYSRRWSMEVTFRNAKQHMGLTDPQNGWWRRKHGTRRAKPRIGAHPRGNRGRRAIERTLPLYFFAYSLTVLWYLQHGEPEQDVQWAMDESPWYAHKAQPSFLDMLVSIRRCLWASRGFVGWAAEAGPHETPEGPPRWMLAA